MVYYSPNRNLIYSAQFGFLTTGATSIYIFARKFFGDLIVTPQMTAIGVDEAGMIGAGVILVAHVIAFGVLLNRAVLRMYLDDKETEFVLAMPSMLVPFRTRTLKVEPNSASRVSRYSFGIVSKDGKNATVYLWYDNEFGYTCQVVRLAKHAARVRRHVFY